MNKSKLTHGSLFSGIEGFGLAARWAGIPTLWHCEKNLKRQKILKQHFPNCKIYGDIKDMINDEIQAVSIITGGPPCQPVSFAGKRRGKADDRYLWGEALEIVYKIRPNWIIFENPVGFVSMGLDEVLASLENQNYTTRPFNIPACGINAPHRRERIWIIAHSYGHYSTMYQRWDQLQEAIRKRAPGRIYCRIGRQWEAEPGVGRVVYGIPHRVDRIEGLGKAVVPQIPYIFFEIIKMIESLNE